MILPLVDTAEPSTANQNKRTTLDIAQDYFLTSTSKSLILGPSPPAFGVIRLDATGYAGTAINALGNVILVGDIDQTGDHNITGLLELVGNADVTGDVIISGDTTSGFFIGDGSQLTNLPQWDGGVVTQPSDFQNTVEFDGVTTIKATGSFVLEALSTLTSNGVATFNANVIVDALATLDVNGSAAFAGTLQLEATGDLDIDGTSNFSALATFTGGLVSTGAGSNSTRIGSGALAAGTDSVAIGLTASAEAPDSISIGANTINTVSNPATMFGGIAIGDGASVALTATGGSGIAIGRGAAVGTGANNGVAIGQTAKANGGNGVAVNIGHSNAAAPGMQVVIGQQSTALASIVGVVVGTTNSITGGGGASHAIVFGDSNTIPSNTPVGTTIIVGRNNNNRMGNFIIGTFNAGSGVSNLVFGVNNTLNADNNIILSYRTNTLTVSGDFNIHIGNSTSAVTMSGTHNVILGYNSSSTGSQNIVLGGGTSTALSNTAFIGTASTDIQTVIFGEGDTVATPNARTIRFTNGTGTDNAAGNLTIVAPRSTGNATAASIIFQIGAVGGSGSTLQTATNRFIINTTTINIPGIPTSAAGLTSGDVWSNAGVLTIV